ncbi:MAG: hypothetical protein ABRQ39_30895 [Candidatus Eremiobacterota bacterium]
MTVKKNLKKIIKSPLYKIDDVIRRKDEKIKDKRGIFRKKGTTTISPLL